MTNAPKEIIVLAKHQRMILEHRFPNYEHFLYERASPCLMNVGNDSCSTILQITFYPDRISIISSFKDEDEENTINIEGLTIVKYADPKFTDDTISDILKEWEVKHA